MSTREKQVYKETYKAGAARLLPNKMPTLKHLNEGYEVVEAELRASGVVRRGDHDLEFQDIRIYVKEMP